MNKIAKNDIFLLSRLIFIRCLLRSRYLLFLFLIPLFVFKVHGQTISTQKGLTTAVFTIAQGKIKVYLPDDIRPGDVISGRIELEPEGKNSRQTEKNLEELLNHSIGFNNEKFPVDKPGKLFKFIVPVDKPLQGQMELFHVSNSKALQQINVPPKPVSEQKSAPSECVLPSHALTASPLRITGPFDGDASNTQCSLNNKPLEMLAESPRQIIISYPADAEGIRTLTIHEKDRSPCTKAVSGVVMDVSAGKLDLQKGERTYIDVAITGLQNLPKEAILTLNNITTAVVVMSPSNNVVIPLFPDSVGSGTFKQRFNIQSITTGSFAVNVNLDLPEIPANANPNSDIPPGYIKKSCECSVTAVVIKTGSNSFKVVANGECKGAYGIGISTFTRCERRGIAYEWSIAEGQQNAEAPSRINDSTFTVRAKNSGTFIVCVKVTVQCIDGTTCTVIACADQAGNTVGTPGTVTRPPENPPPTTEREKCKCECSATANINKTGKGLYTANVIGACKPGPCPPGATVVQCSVKDITYNWAVTVGGAVVEIVGAVNTANVGLKIKGTGKFVLTVTGSVNCSDGTYCSFMATIEDEVEEGEEGCQLTTLESPGPAMDGGLKSKYIKNGKEIKRDDFILLGAEGADYDQLKWTCEPQKPECRDSRSVKHFLLTSRVKFEWTILNGEGNFVKLGCLPNNVRNDAGENIIFKPPYVPLPKGADTSVTTTITLSVIDDNPTQPQDIRVDKPITVITKRIRNKPDIYIIDVRSGIWTQPSKRLPNDTAGTCEALGPVWDQLTPITPEPPVIQLPTVADNDKMVTGQWIVLQTGDHRDADKLTVNCKSAANCKTAPWEKVYEDSLVWDWQKPSAGLIVSDRDTRSIIYEAPQEIPGGADHIDVEIKVVVKNTGGKIADGQTAEGKITLRIYKAGVKLSHPDITWLPDENNDLELTSELMYKNGDWQPALAHMCRIHYFELMNVSTEKGICMNAPMEDATICRDLQLKNGNQHEAFQDSARRCTEKEMFMQARTQQPVKEYSIKIYSKDFGSYGFLRSFANLNKGGKDSIKSQKPVYHPIPAHLAHQLRHPGGRAKRTLYQDNRVTIPYDIDENHIPDTGWLAFGGVRVTDPLWDTTDLDEQPVGDGFRGDGLSTYEEYRGFKILGNVHLRTNYDKKDIFIHNPASFPLGLFSSITAMDVHTISQEQYNGHNSRVINFNFSRRTHIVDQRGLRLVSKSGNDGVLGLAHSVFCDEDKPKCKQGRPSPPNWIREVRIYPAKITEVCGTKRIADPAAKLSAVVAHELLHANNVCHHGEADADAEVESAKHNALNGLRSGDTTCVMRYDNIGTPVVRRGEECVQIRRADAVAEVPGTTLCTSPAGIGYNLSTFKEERRGGQLIRVEYQHCFGNAAANRGNCLHQFRVSGRGWNSRTPAANAPNSCGGRGL